MVNSAMNNVVSVLKVVSHLDVGVLALEVPPRAGHRAARAHTADQDVDLPRGVLPDLGPRGLEVHLRGQGAVGRGGDARGGTLAANSLRREVR